MASTYVFAGLTKSLSSFCSDIFMKRKIEKRNILYAMSFLVDDIEKWTQSDSIFIQMNCNPVLLQVK
ncbi:MAG: hypothetical protein ACLSSW_05725 [Acutalibacteraceae bacterium]